MDESVLYAKTFFVDLSPKKWFVCCEARIPIVGWRDWAEWREPEEM